MEKFLGDLRQSLNNQFSKEEQEKKPMPSLSLTPPKFTSQGRGRNQQPQYDYGDQGYGQQPQQMDMPYGQEQMPMARGGKMRLRGKGKPKTGFRLTIEQASILDNFPQPIKPKPKRAHKATKFELGGPAHFHPEYARHQQERQRIAQEQRRAEGLSPFMKKNEARTKAKEAAQQAASRASEKQEAQNFKSFQRQQKAKLQTRHEQRLQEGQRNAALAGRRDRTPRPAMPTGAQSRPGPGAADNTHRFYEHDFPSLPRRVAKRGGIQKR